MWHLGKHTHKLWPVVNEKDSARPPPVGPVRFISNIKALPVSSPIHQSPVWGICVVKALDGGWDLQDHIRGCVCVRVFLGRGGGSETGAVARVRGPVAFSTVWHPRVQWEHQPSVSHQQR